MSTEAISNEKLDGRKSDYNPIATTLSFNDKVQAPSLPRFTESSRSTLNEIQRDFSLSQFYPEDSIFLQRAAKRLAGLCSDSDQWGFDSLYRVASGLQALLLKSFNQAKNDCFWEALNQGLMLLFSLLDRCEKDYHQRMIVADTLESFKRAACR